MFGGEGMMFLGEGRGGWDEWWLMCFFWENRSRISSSEG